MYVCARSVSRAVGTERVCDFGLETRSAATGCPTAWPTRTPVQQSVSRNTAVGGIASGRDAQRLELRIQGTFAAITMTPAKLPLCVLR